MDPVGKELEDKLKSFREELIKLDEKENMRERLEKEIEINDFLIDVVESQLNNNFGIKL